jgi:hypothetical protein
MKGRFSWEDSHLEYGYMPCTCIGLGWAARLCRSVLFPVQGVSASQVQPSSSCLHRYEYGMVAQALAAAIHTVLKEYSLQASDSLSTGQRSLNDLLPHTVSRLLPGALSADGDGIPPSR